jgi:hypothetical protein
VLGTVERRAEIRAIEEEQLLPVLKSLGVGAEYESGALRCSFCERSLKEAGIATVRMEQGRLVFVCSQLQCMEHMYG